MRSVFVALLAPLLSLLSMGAIAQGKPFCGPYACATFDTVNGRTQITITPQSGSGLICWVAVDGHKRVFRLPGPTSFTSAPGYGHHRFSWRCDPEIPTPLWRRL